MKQYVLAEPDNASDHPIEAPTRHRRDWRAVIYLIVLEPIALGALCLGLSGTPIWSAATAGVSTSSAPAVLAYSPPFAPSSERPATSSQEKSSGYSHPSSVTRRGDKFFVDLNAVEIGTALAIMTKATGVSVTGSDALLRQQVRITRTVVTSSVLAAWQSVFGDVANFAASCVGKSCVVHIVSTAEASQPGPPAPPAAITSQITAPPAIVPDAAGASQSANGRPTIPQPAPVATTYTEDN